ncbi:MAG: sigma-54-dependent Fis family transcriptional regulator [Acidobacteria bacterium]|nr:sigma-54-dependent Fis family transcriptional regulator [Acidobacteriota bacterium]
MDHILIIEDQPAVARALQILFEVHDLPAVTCADPERALAVLAQDDVGLVVQDMNFSPGETSGREGIELFRKLRAIDPELPVLALTAWASLEAAVQMIKEGASDYLAKPWEDGRLLATARNLLEIRRLRRIERGQEQRPGVQDELAASHDLRGLVYESVAMHRLVSLAVQVAASDVPVLITGPNGTGKEKLAEIVQANSPRRGGPFVKINAAALPDELLESELFGAEPGAYTGAVRRRIGRFEAADGGTLFLDEIGLLSPAGQSKLLRVLQSGEFERLGSSETRRVDVRLLAATNADLREAMSQRTFRDDLYFRISVIELNIPALRERPDDILPLAEHFLAEPGLKERRLALSPRARAALLAHDWPGNVRELRNRIQRAVLIAGGPPIEPEHLGLVPARQAFPATSDPERRRIEQVLLETGGVVSKAAAELGLSRQALYRKMERLGIALERRLRE